MVLPAAAVSRSSFCTRLLYSAGSHNCSRALFAHETGQVESLFIEGLYTPGSSAAAVDGLGSVGVSIVGSQVCYGLGRCLLWLPHDQRAAYVHAEIKRYQLARY